jgi:NAD(P)-dependent dehydrogenase (short-subunit alcohol dehydrogenase family)
MYEKNLLAGRVVLVTGGGTGLGLAMAKRMTELGAGLFIVGRREAPLRQAAEQIREAGGECGIAACDVRDPAAVHEAVAAAESHFGRVDTLINNAAGNFIARTEKLSPNAFATVVSTVLHGTFHCTLALGQRWIAARQPGTILNIVTTYAQNGSGFVVPSACAKAGVLAMTKSLAVEWARYRIRLNAIAPGPFPTEGAWSRLIPSAQYEHRLQHANPMKRFGRQEELANLAVYLLSPQSEYINGECVVIDGGQWLRGAGAFNELAELPDAAWAEIEAARERRFGQQGAEG